MFVYLVDTKSTEREEDKKGAKIGKDKLPLDDGTKSLEKISIATMDDGEFITILESGKGLDLAIQIID